MDLDKIIWAVLLVVLIIILFTFLPEICMLSILGYIVYKLFFEKK